MIYDWIEICLSRRSIVGQTSTWYRSERARRYVPAPMAIRSLTVIRRYRRRRQTLSKMNISSRLVVSPWSFICRVVFDFEIVTACYFRPHRRLAKHTRLPVTRYTQSRQQSYNSHGLVMGTLHFQPAPVQNRRTLTDRQKFCHRWLHPRLLYSCAKFGGNPCMGGFWTNRWNITPNFYLYLLFEWLTYRSLCDGSALAHYS